MKGSNKIWFDAGLDNSSLKKDAQEASKTISDIGKTAEETGSSFEKSMSNLGASIDDVFNSNSLEEFSSQIENQRKAVESLEQQYNQAERALKKLGESDKGKKVFSDEEIRKGTEEYKKAKKILDDVNKELKAESRLLSTREELFGKMSAEMDKLFPKQKTYMTQLRNIREEMMALELSGKQETPRYRELQSELEKTGTAYRKVQQEQKLLTTAGSSTLAGLLQGANALSGAFTVAQGATALFVKDNERLAAIQTKLQAAIAITVGLQQAQTALHQTSAFRIGLVSKATNLWKNAQIALNTQLGIGAGLSKAFMTLGIAGLVAGIIYLVSKYKEWNKEQEKLQKTTTEFNSELAKEQRIVNDLFNAYSKTNPETNKHKRIKDSIIDRYGEYIKHLIDEKGRITDIGEAMKIVNERLQEHVALKIRNQAIEGAFTARFDTYTSQVDQLMGQIKKKESDPKKLGEIRKYINEQMSKFIDADRNELSSLVSEVSQTLQNKFGLENIYAGIGENIGFSINNLANSMQKANEQVADTRSQYDGLINDIISVDDLLKKDTSGKDGEKQKKKEQEAKDLQQRILNNQKRAALEAQGIEIDNQQKMLDLEEDGFIKRQKQIELNHEKEKLRIKKRTQELIEAQQQAEREKWEESGRKGLFVSSTQSLLGLSKDNQSEIEQSEYVANEVKKKATDDLLKSLLDKYKTYNERRAEINAKYDEDLTRLESLPASNANDAKIEKLKNDWQKALKSINDEEASELMKSSDLFVRLFTDASQQSVKQIRRVIDETQSLYDLLSKKNKDGSAYEITEKDAQEIGFTVEQLNKFKGDAEQLKAILDGLIAKKKELAGKSEFQAFSQSIGDAIKKIEKGGIENIGAGITDIGNAVNQFAPQVKQFGNDLGTIFGDEKLAEDIGLATDALSGLATTGAGVGKIMSGDVVGGIQSVVSGVASLVTVFGKLKDRKKEKEIQKLQKQVELLEKAYQSLGRAIDKAYSKDASELIGQQNEALEKQKVLIQQQIKAERDKKKTDKSRIKEWEQQIEEIDLLIEQNKEKAIDAIFGQDIKSAIEDFADAYVEAWSAGEDRAKASKDFVKKMIKQMVVEAMKADISEPMKKIREKLEQFWQDGFISANEEDIINHMVEQLDKELSDKYAWADKYLDSNEGNRNSTAKGVATASQDSVDEMNGRFSVIQSHTYELNENVKILRANSSAVLKHLAGIESNTANTNTRLELVEAAIIAVSSGIDAINLHGIILKK